MKKDKKEITIVIPVHNRFDYLEKCLFSVINQNKPEVDLKIIIVDDGSDLLVKDYIKNHPVLRNYDFTIIRNSQSQGPALARNKGIKYITGDYVAFLDSDDFWRPDFLSTMLKQLDPSRFEIAICMMVPVFSGGYSFFERIYYSLLTWNRNICLILSKIISNHLSVNYVFMTRLSGMIFTYRTAKNVLFDKYYQHAEDWKFVYECIMSHSGIVKIVPEFLVDISYAKGSYIGKRAHYWGYYYKFLDEMPDKIRNSFGMKYFKFYTDFSVWKNKSTDYLHYRSNSHKSHL